MRITIDLDKKQVIVPDSYFRQIDKMNNLLEEHGGTPVEYTKYVVENVNKALEKPFKRKADISVENGKGKNKAKDKK